MLTILYYTCSAIFLLYAILDITWRIWKRKLSFLPSAPNVPWLGTTPYLSGDPHEQYKLRTSFNSKFNHLYVSWFGMTPIIKIGCVEYAEALLKSQEALTKSVAYEISQEWLGDGLLTSRKTKWKKRRTALTGAFHFAVLNDFMEIYERHARNLVSKLQIVASKGEEIEVQWPISLATLDVICETSMGVQINALNSSDSEYVRAVHDIKSLLLKRFSNPFFMKKTLYQFTSGGRKYYKLLHILHNFTIKVINDNLASRKNPSSGKKVKEDYINLSYRKRKKVFIDVLLDLYDKGEIDAEGIREEVDTFMFEGHDTTSSGLSWTLYEIGRHPEIQEKLHEEIDSVSSNESSLMDKVRMLKYMECVIKESLRMHPPVPSYSRTLEKDMVINNNIIPTGTIMAIDALSVHMNPANWDQPTVFNPARFESDEKRNPYSYLPFSAGSRNCIGQKFAMLEEKVFIYLILLNFTVKSTQTPDEIKTGVDLITHSVNGIHIEFRSRK